MDGKTRRWDNSFETVNETIKTLFIGFGFIFQKVGAVIAIFGPLILVLATSNPRYFWLNIPFVLYLVHKLGQSVEYERRYR